MATIGSLLIKLGLDAQAFTSGLDQSAKRLGKIGDDLTGVGRRLSLGVTAPIVALGGAAIKTAADFESGFAGVRKTVNATEEEFAELKSGLLAVAQEIPASQETLFQVAESAGQLGVAKENILSFTRTIVDLGNTTNLMTDQAASEMARLANVMRIPQDQFDRVGSTIVELGNNLATTEAEILELAQRLAGAGKTAGLNVQEVLGLSGALSSVGINAEAGGTAFSKLLRKIVEVGEVGGPDLEKFASLVGKTSEQFRQDIQERPADAIRQFIESILKLKEEGGSVFGTLGELIGKEVRLNDAILRSANAGELLAKSLELADGAFKSNTALSDEAAKRYETVISQFQVFQNRVANVSAKIGDQLLPAVTRILETGAEFVEWVSSVVDGFQQLDPGVQAVVTAFTVAFASSGPILVVVGTFMAALAAVTTPLLVGGAIIAGIIGGITAMVIHWDTIKNIPNVVMKMVQDVKLWLVERFQSLVVNPVKEKINAVSGFFKGMFDAVVGNSYVPDMIDGIEFHFNRLDAVMVSPTQKAVSQTSGLFQDFSGSALSAFSQADTQLSGIVDKSIQVPQMLGTGFDEVGKKIGGNINFLDSSFSSFSNNISSSLETFVTTGKASFKDFANSVISDLARIAARAATAFIFSSALKALSGGTPSAPETFATGGAVSGGVPIIVGEEGPELFVPGSGGEIVPNNALSTIGNSTAGIGGGIGAVGAGVGAGGGSGTFGNMAQGFTEFTGVFLEQSNIIIERWKMMLQVFETTWQQQLSVMTEVEKAKTELFRTENDVRRVILIQTNALSLAGTNAILAGMTAVATGIIAIGGIVSIMMVSLLTAIATALASNPFTAPIAAATFAAASLLAITSSVILASASLSLALATASAASAAAAAFTSEVATQVPEFGTGGAVFGPTLALVGENEPELITPFSQARKLFDDQGSKEQKIEIYLDSKTIAKRTIREFPKLVRMQGVPT